MPKPLSLSRETVVRLWLERQGLLMPRGNTILTPSTLSNFLRRTGGLQIDPMNTLERAHYLTLWSRFGVYEPDVIDTWIYNDGMAYEYWGHQATLLPISHLPLGLRRMRRFPPANWSKAAWWEMYQVSTASKRRVLRRLRKEGPLESGAFEKRSVDEPAPGTAMPLPKEDKRALQLLWHAGRVAVCNRRHFRRAYDLAERVYPDLQPASLGAFEDSWLFIGLSGNGIASEQHLVNYWMAPDLAAAARRRVITRNLKKKLIVETQVDGLRGPFFALPKHLDNLFRVPEPHGTTLICPFDSLLWQRKRAEDLLDFSYRIEIYVPPSKRVYGYYVLPILHNGRLVGRLDPKMHRDRSVLEVKAVYLEPWFEDSHEFTTGLRESLASLATFVKATDLHVPAEWGKLT